MPKKRPSGVPIGDVLRQRRAEVLKKGLREMARELNIAPAHLTDLELGRRSPSEDLLLRITRCYGIPEADLRAGWSKPESIVKEVATQDAMTAAKLPEFLRTARNLTPDQWNKIIKQARRMTGQEGEAGS
ncbi:MAG: helix-turn-helix transcriptional regulator [Phycisphaerales bacterium]|nr:helix-turn-helix transcriptional regulator [Phycisphaerales bacterium]